MAHYCDTVGIDLGTTRSCVAVWDGTQVHVIANESGDNTTPSWVCYPDLKQRRVGKAAERAGTKYASSVIYHSKRLIGCRYGEKVIQDAANLRWPFRVVDQVVTFLQGDGGAAIQITVAGQPKIVTPEEVGAGILSYLKKVAEEFIGRPVKKAVITVPAYFNDSQRQATRDAGRIAGLEVKRIINEPTAAALAFGVLDSHSMGTKNLLVDCCRVFDVVGERNVQVFDFGGGTLDVTIMQIEANSMNFLVSCRPRSPAPAHCLPCQVRATDGDTRLGGEDIDARLVDHFLDVFQKHTGVDLGNAKESDKKKKALAKLRAAAAQLKIDLSRMTESDICLDELYQDETLEAKMTRDEFESLVGDLLERVRLPVMRALEKVHGGMKAEDIDQVLLVGGSSRIPKVQQILQEMFPNKELCRRINPDEAIAVGAAMDGSHQYQMVDVVPRALGVATANHEDPSRQFTTIIIPACSPIPEGGLIVTSSFGTSRDNQTGADIEICEGEERYFDENTHLGEFELSGLPQRGRGEITINVTMSVDKDGILTVTGTAEGTDIKKDISVRANKGRMSEDTIRRLQTENEEYEKYNTRDP
ncbi:heat shock protein 70-like protein [Guillardia theta CCMP2712]|uniref:Heat shock protein 70-like protein n=1 Tax=Guillardia theta (strain CCMP2712) TaxID=905079 RepID=L1JK08_GUITC|nr:heat shock protein 70-like protein [Guillardia theta CCMP2712]EKX48806.1 heat shock protein 70-like protein [Guillardia theta CCMP2712]|eukprot:XP_005835786.1 heat shock protein 70-like protein [Guillardia theta CCMP2712]